MDDDIPSNTMGASKRVTASYAMPTAFMGLVGQPFVTLGAAASVSKPVKLKSAMFKLDGVTGAWDKTVTMMGRLTPTSPYLPLLQMVYATTNIGGWGTTILSTPDPKSKKLQKWVEQRWEDGGGHEGTSAWDGTDFRYFVKGGCSTSGGSVRLTN